MCSIVPNRIDKILDIATVPEKRMSGRRYDQSLNLGEINTLKSVIE